MSINRTDLSPKQTDRYLAALQRLETMLSSEAFEYLNNWADRWPYKRIIELSNFWYERAERTIRMIMDGQPVSLAFRYRPGEFDTHSWNEVESRLRRFRGMLLKSAIYQYRIPRNFSESKRQRLIQSINQIRSDCYQILQCTANFPLEPTEFGEFPDSVERAEIDLANRSMLNIGPQINFVASVVGKCADNIPKIPRKLGLPPTVVQRAVVNIEVMRLLQAAQLLFRMLDGHELPPPERTQPGRDPFGVGPRYARLLSSAESPWDAEFRIATHCNPDADALVSAWLLSRFHWRGLSSKVEFVRGRNSCELNNYNAVVDIGGCHEPSRLRFDHKQPAFQNRDETCSTKLVWQYLTETGWEVANLSNLVELVHDGDAVSRRGSSIPYSNSRRNGLHAHIDALRQLSESDEMLCNSALLWLDSLFLNEPSICSSSPRQSIPRDSMIPFEGEVRNVAF